MFKVGDLVIRIAKPYDCFTLNKKYKVLAYQGGLINKIRVTDDEGETGWWNIKNFKLYKPKTKLPKWF